MELADLTRCIRKKTMFQAFAKAGANEFHQGSVENNLSGRDFFSQPQPRPNPSPLQPAQRVRRQISQEARVLWHNG